MIREHDKGNLKYKHRAPRIYFYEIKLHEKKMSDDFYGILLPLLLSSSKVEYSP